MINQVEMNNAMRGNEEGILGMISLFSGGSLSQSTIFGLGIMPYISASIIFQLLASVYPPLEKLQKEGEVGQQRPTADAGAGRVRFGSGGQGEDLRAQVVVAIQKRAIDARGPSDRGERDLVALRDRNPDLFSA